MSNVRLDADGKYTVTAGDSTDYYTTLREALDAALPTVATHEKTARLRNPDSGDLNGAWRWLPATDVEPAAIGGVRIDAQAIREMADSLNARPGPVPVDGGPTPKGLLASDVHGTATTGGGTPANGWAHWGVVVEGPTAEQAKLYLYAELIPEVAREVDAGRIATGSVHFGASELDGELPRGVELISHALTNDPAVKTLAPANSVRGVPLLLSRSVHVGAALRARSPKESIMATKTNVRGPAMDAEAKIFSLFGVDPAADDADCQLRERIWSVMSAADQEEAVTAVMGGGAAPAPTAASASFRTKLKTLDALIVAKNAKGLAAALRDAGAAAPAAPAEQRAAVAGLADEAAKDAAISQLLALLAKNGVGKEGDDFATALAALDAHFQAMASEAAAEGDAGQMASAEAAKAAARADVIGLRSELATEKAERAKDRAKIDALEQRETQRAVEGQVEAALRASKRVMSAADRTQLVADLVAEKDEAVRARNLTRAAGASAPAGNVMGNTAKDTSATGGHATFEAAVESVMEEARKSVASPRLDVIRAKARVIARKRWPGLESASEV